MEAIAQAQGQQTPRQTSGKPEPARRASLEPLRLLAADDMVAVNAEILRRMQSHVTLIPELASHIIAAGGKRIRPMLTLAAARLCGYRGTAHVLLATCVEFIHTATLLHDDVVDESGLRRGNATANTLWGNQASVLVGDFLFSRAFQLMVEAGSLDVLGILADASATIAEGEVLQLVTSNDTATTEDDYLRVITAKTAALFAAACKVGAVIAGRGADEAAALDDYGRNLGIAFQLVDDALDYAAEQTTLGKSLGDDFKEGKITLPVLIAFRRGNDEERAFWRRTLEKLEQNAGDFERALQMMARHQSIPGTLAEARRYADMARAALGAFPAGPIRSALDEVADFCVERAF